MRFLLLVLSVLIYSYSVYSQQCVSGGSNMHLRNQLREMKTTSPITSAIYRQYNLEATEGGYCAICEGNAVLASPVGRILIPGVDSPEAPKLAFKTECLRFTNKYVRPAGAQLMCPQRQFTDRRNRSQDLCMDMNFLRYQNAVISNFMLCAKKAGFQGLDARTLYRMYSIESGFQPQHSYGGGHGMGQLTMPFIRDLHEVRPTAAGGRASALTQLSTNPSIECNVAKEIARKDAGRPPISTRANTCDYITVGEGMERNILYSIIGMSNTWTRYVQPKIRAYLAAAEQRGASQETIREIQSFLTLTAFGPGGLLASNAFIRRFQHLPPEAFLQRLKTGPVNAQVGRSGRTLNLTAYSRNIVNRHEALIKSFANDGGTPDEQAVRTRFASRGPGGGAEACVNPP